jgi:hypothetical protein
MTAEIAVLNRNAVALAADSAVTLRLPDGSTKIYQTNKLFTLSKFEPVGIMVYGNADFMGVPWETIVKRYRAGLKTRSFGQLDEYGQDFLAFVEKNSKLFPQDRQEAHCYEWIRYWLRRLKSHLRAELEQKLKSEGPQTDRAVQDLFRQIFSAELSHLRKHKVLPSFRRKRLRGLSRNCRAAIRSAAKDELQKLANTVPLNRLVSAAVIAIARDNYWHNESGIVVAGFGSDEFFPSLRCYTVDSIIAGRLRAKEERHRRTDINTNNSAVVTAFAQSEMVSLFMNGIDDDYADFVSSFVGQSFLDGYPALIGEILKKEMSASRRSRLLKRLHSVGGQLVSELRKGIDQYAREMHSSPIVEIVDHLPKEELAAMAEALVNLTSFKRHVTRQAETVGGPIDVAVISRGDGFIWIKGKHYFDRDLNQHFLSNYYYDVKRSGRA